MTPTVTDVIEAFIDYIHAGNRNGEKITRTMMAHLIELVRAEHRLEMAIDSKASSDTKSLH